jgi:hypothetical protein
MKVGGFGEENFGESSVTLEVSADAEQQLATTILGPEQSSLKNVKKIETLFE